MEVTIFAGSTADALSSSSVFLFIVTRISCSITATNSSPETADVAEKSTTNADEGKIPRRARRFLQIKRSDPFFYVPN